MWPKHLSIFSFSISIVPSKKLRFRLTSFFAKKLVKHCGSMVCSLEKVNNRIISRARATCFPANKVHFRPKYVPKMYLFLYCTNTRLFHHFIIGAKKASTRPQNPADLEVVFSNPLVSAFFC